MIGNNYVMKIFAGKTLKLLSTKELKLILNHHHTWMWRVFAATTDARYGGENDSYALSSVECSGRERHLAACLSKQWREDCDGGAPAGVRCVGK